MANDVNIRFTAEDVASEVVRRLGGNLGGLTDKINPLSAAFGALGATLTAGAVIGALKSTINALDELNDAAEAAGVTVEALSSLRFAASFGGIGAEQLDKALIKLNGRLVDAAQGGKQSGEIFRALGINVRDGAGDVLSSDAALAQLADRFASFRNGAEKSALAAEIFGEKVGPKLLPLLNQGAAGIEELRREAERLGVAVSSEQAAAAGRFNDQIDRLLQGFAGIRNNIASAVLPSLIELLDEFERGIRIFGSFGAAFSNLSTVNPFRTLGGNIAETRAEIERLRVAQNAAIDEFGQDSDGGVGRRLLQGEIDLLEKRLTFLQETQRVRALEGSGGVLDANDARAARGQGGDAVPRIGGAAAADPAKAEKERIEALKALTLARQRDVEAQIATDAIIEGQRAKQLEAEQVYAAQVVQIGQQRLAAVQAQLATQEQGEVARFQRQIEQLQTALLTGAANEGEFYALREQAEQQHQERITQIRDQEEARRLGIARLYRQLDLQSAGAFLGQMAALINSSSRKAFEVGKVAAIGETVINTYKAATGAYAALAGIPIVGPALGAAAAAAAIGAGLANVQRIKNTPFGGGGGSVASSAVATPGQGPFAASGAAEAPAAPVQQRAPAQINVTLVGEGTYSASQVRSLIEQINQQLSLGAELRAA